MRTLSLRQLAGVLAHEMSHVRNGDLKVMALGDVLTRITSFMAQVGYLSLLISLPAMLAAGTKVPWLALAGLILAPLFGGLLQLALSRTREYDADLDAAAITGDPEALASALALLEKKQGRMWEGLVLPGGRVPDPSILRTHPRAEERIARLLKSEKGHPARAARGHPHRDGRALIVPPPPAAHPLGTPRHLVLSLSPKPPGVQ